MKEIQTQLKALAAETERYRELKVRLYQDMQDGIVGKDEFKEINGRFTKKISAALDTQRKLEAKLENLQKEGTELQPWIEEFKACRNIEHLERSMVASLIDHIDVYGKDKIEIHFRFENEIREMVKSMEYYEEQHALERSTIGLEL